MAELKSLIVNGITRLNNTGYAKNLYADKFITNGGTAQQYVKGDGTLGNISDFSGSGHNHGTSKTIWGQTYVNASGQLQNVTDSLYLPNNAYISWKDSGGNDRIGLWMTVNDVLFVGRGMAEAGQDVWLSGNNLNLTYGTSKSTGIYINSSGNVGVGTSSPSYKLHTVGTSTNFASPISVFQNNSDAAWIANAGFISPNLTAGHYTAIEIGKAMNQGNVAHLSFYYDDSDSANNRVALGFYNYIDLFVVKRDGKVGIGTASPSQKLHLSGGIIQVTNNSKYVQIGPQNSSWCHFQSDATFYFNPAVCVDGNVYPYTSLSYNLGTSSYYWNNVYANGFIKKDSSNDYVLLGAGGHKSLSDFFIRNTNMYGLENLCTDVTAGGQTTRVDYKTITTSGTTSDTYFYVVTTENLSKDQIYTFGWYVSGYTGSNTWTFYASNNSSCIGVVVNKNGWVWGTGKMLKSDAADTNSILIDDAGSSAAQGLTFSNFVIVKGDIFPYYTVPINRMHVEQADLVDRANYQGRDTFIQSPKGGTYVTSDSTKTGYLRIKLPCGMINVMLTFFVDIYIYSMRCSVTYKISGYNYSGGWVNTTAQCVSSYEGSYANLSVRFGTLDSKAAVEIGESNSSWSYPQVVVRDVLFGYSSNATLANFFDSWSIDFNATSITVSTYGGDQGHSYHEAVGLKAKTAASAAALSAIIANDKLPTRLRELCTANTISSADSSKVSGWAYITASSPFKHISSNNDYMLISTGYNTSWCGQIAENFYTNDIAFRTLNNGTWTSWAYPIMWRESQLSDANGVNTTGIWTHTGFSNRPTGVRNWGSLFNIRLYTDNNVYHRQLFFDCYNTDRIWTRSDDAGTWTGWSELVTTKSYTATAVTGLDGSYFLIHCTVSASATLGFSTAPCATEGRECHLIIYNSGSSNITITIPTTINSVTCRRTSGTLVIAPSSFGDISIVYANSLYYIRCI